MMSAIIIAVLLVFGFFPIVSQTLLFREYLIAFNGNEISITAFFSSWLFWIFIGALIFRYNRNYLFKSGINPLFLLPYYVPLFIIQWILIFNIRDLANIATYELFPLKDLIVSTVFSNAPMSLFTGFMFPFLAAFLKDRWKLRTIGYIFCLEAGGSFIGGLLCTLLLYFQIHSLYIFVIASFIIILTVLIYCLISKYSWFAYGMLLLLIVLLPTIIHPNDLYQWKSSQILPDSILIDGKSTSKGELLHLKRKEQVVLIYNGKILETVPNKESNGTLAALTMAESNTPIQSLLIIGAKAGLAELLSNTDQIPNIYVYFPDNFYYPYVFNSVFQDSSVLLDKKVTVLNEDPLSYLPNKGIKLDAVLILMGDPDTGVQNHFYTVQYLEQLASYMSHNSLVLTETTGINNFAGQEIVNFGRSIYLTLKQVFPNIIIKPGRQTFFIASKSNMLTDSPRILEERLKKLKQSFFPTKTLYSLFSPNRIKLAQELYNTDAPQSFFLNTSQTPKSYLFSLLLLAKYSYSPFAKLFNQLRLLHIVPFLLSMFLFILFYWLYWRNTTVPRAYTFHRSMAFVSGLCGMSLTITFLYKFQTLFGSVFLYIGLITALYMIGLFLGSLMVSRFTTHHEQQPLWSLFISSLIIISLAIINLPPYKSIYCSIFLLIGILTGRLFPQAALLLASRGVESSYIGSMLEASEHVGACIGGLLTGLILLPIIGFERTILLSGSIIIIPFLMQLIQIYSTRKPHYQLSFYAIIFTWVMVSIVIATLWIDREEDHLFPPLEPMDVKHFEPSFTGKIPPSGFVTFPVKTSITQTPSTHNYIFSSAQFAHEVHGYGGPINIVIKALDEAPNNSIGQIGQSGQIEDFFIKSHKETPYYFNKVLPLITKIKDQKISQLGNIDVITGATVTSKAIINSISQSTHKVFGPKGHYDSNAKTVPSYLSYHFWYLIIAILASIILMNDKLRSWRTPWLIVNLLVGGFFLNLQYSSIQIASLLGFNFPTHLYNYVMILTLALPLLVIFWGNFYCGYMCPFGALQELIMKLGNKIWLTPTSTPVKPIFYQALKLKYILFFLAFLLFLLTEQKEFFNFDPLISVFEFTMSSSIWILLFAVLIASILFPRFWCRYFCITGAFLSMLAFFKPLNKKVFKKSKHYPTCKYNVKHQWQLDCIECNNCGS